MSDKVTIKKEPLAKGVPFYDKVEIKLT